MSEQFIIHMHRQFNQPEHITTTDHKIIQSELRFDLGVVRLPMRPHVVPIPVPGVTPGSRRMGRPFFRRTHTGSR